MGEAWHFEFGVEIVDIDEYWRMRGTLFL